MRYWNNRTTLGVGMGYLKKILHVAVSASLVLILATVFLHPAYSDNHTDNNRTIQGIVVCACGKASYLITYGKHPITPMAQNDKTQAICQGRHQFVIVGEAVLAIIRVEDQHKGMCPVST